MRGGRLAAASSCLVSEGEIEMKHITKEKLQELQGLAKLLAVMGVRNNTELENLHSGMSPPDGQRKYFYPTWQAGFQNTLHFVRKQFQFQRHHTCGKQHSVVNTMIHRYRRSAAARYAEVVYRHQARDTAVFCRRAIFHAA